MRLKNWMRLGFYYMGIMVVVLIILDVLMDVSIIEDGQEQSLTLYSPISLFIFGGIVSAVYTIGIYRSEIPLALSFGATRREVFVGIQLVRAIPMIAILLLATAVTLFDRTVTIVSFLCGIGCMLFIQALSAGLRALSIRFGKIVSIVSVGVLGASVALAIFLGVMAAEQQLSWYVAPTLLIVGLIAYAAVLPFEWRAIKHLTVKL